MKVSEGPRTRPQKQGKEVLSLRRGREGDVALRLGERGRVVDGFHVNGHARRTGPERRRGGVRASTRVSPAAPRRGVVGRVPSSPAERCLRPPDPQHPPAAAGPLGRGPQAPTHWAPSAERRLPGSRRAHVPLGRGRTPPAPPRSCRRRPFCGADPDPSRGAAAGSRLFPVLFPPRRGRGQAQPPS